MLFNGERVGDGTGAGVRHRRRPDRRHHADRQGHAQRHRRARRRRPRARCSTRPPSSTWTSWSPAPRPPTSSTSTRPSSVNIRRVAKAKGVHARGRHRRHPRPAPPRGHRQGDPRDRRAHQVHLRRRRGRRDHGRCARAPASTCCSASAARPRASSRPARSSASAAPSRASCGRRTTRSGSGRSTPGTTWTGCCTTDDLVTGDNVFFVATGITDGELLRGVRYRAETATTAVAGDAFEVRHDPADRLRRTGCRSCAPTARSTSTARS